MSNVEKLKKGLKEFGLEHKAEELLPLAKESIRMMVSQIPEEKIQIGNSKIGGCPDVPSDFLWPHTNDNRPLYFLCPTKSNRNQALRYKQLITCRWCAILFL
ncbi:hypothetical protein LSPCS325_49990 [Lysinibacillus sp. CTST325]